MHTRVNEVTPTLFLGYFCHFDRYDAVVMHPWLIHSGTTNLSSEPRLMANGMVRIKPEAFERDGGARALRGLAGDAALQAALRTTITGTTVTVSGTGTGTGMIDDCDGAAMGKRRKTDGEGGDVVEVVPSTGSKTGTGDGIRARPTREELTAASAAAVDAAFAAAAKEGFNSSVDRLRREDDDSLPTVSIIVPVHNAVNWLDECLASVLTQRLTYRGPIQVSVYDDASTAGIVYSHTHNTHCTFH